MAAKRSGPNYGYNTRKGPAIQQGGFNMGQRKPVYNVPAVVGALTPNLGAPPPAAAAAPAPAPKPKPTDDAAYNNAVGQAGKNYTFQMGELATAERKTKFDFGIDDPTNPYSRQAEQKRLYLVAQKGSQGALAARGQLYSGRNLSAQANIRSKGEKATADLRRAYQDALDKIGAARKQAGLDKEGATNAAFEAWLARQGA